jgi:hypothetical protein
MMEFSLSACGGLELLADALGRFADRKSRSALSSARIFSDFISI